MSTATPTTHLAARRAISPNLYEAFNVFPALKDGDFHCWRATFRPDT